MCIRDSIAVGDMVRVARESQALLKKAGLGATLVNLLSVKPLDIRTISRAVSETRCFITLENGYISGGAGQAVVSALPPELRQRLLFNAGFPDEFIPHGSVQELFSRYGLSAGALAERIISQVKVSSLHEKRHTIRRVSG